MGEGVIFIAGAVGLVALIWLLAAGTAHLIVNAVWPRPTPSKEK